MIIAINGDQAVYIDEKTNKVYSDGAMTQEIEAPGWCSFVECLNNAKEKPKKRKKPDPTMGAEYLHDDDPIVVAHGAVFMHDAPREIVDEAKNAGLA